MVVIDLAARAIQEVVMKEQLQTSQQTLSATGQQRSEMIGTQEAMLVNVPEDFKVAMGQMNLDNL